MFAQRLAGQKIDFQSALNALAVIGFQTACRNRVNFLQTAIQACQTVFVLFRLKLCAHRRIRAGQIVQTFRQRVEIHHRAADNQRIASARMYFVHQAHAVADKIRRAVTFQRRDNINQMMRYGGKLFGSRLGCTDVHAAIHQRGIQTDDFHRQRLGNI